MRCCIVLFVLVIMAGINSGCSGNQRSRDAALNVVDTIKSATAKHEQDQLSRLKELLAEVIDQHNDLIKAEWNAAQNEQRAQVAEKFLRKRGEFSLTLARAIENDPRIEAESQALQRQIQNTRQARDKSRRDEYKYVAQLASLQMSVAFFTEEMRVKLDDDLVTRFNILVGAIADHNNDYQAYQINTEEADHIIADTEKISHGKTYLAAIDEACTSLRGFIRTRDPVTTSPLEAIAGLAPVQDLIKQTKTKKDELDKRLGGLTDRVVKQADDKIADVNKQIDSAINDAVEKARNITTVGTSP